MARTVGKLQILGFQREPSMPEHSHKPNFKEVLPKKGLLFQEDVPHLVLCKPKLMPIKSVTLEKLDKMQKDSEAKIRLHSLQPQN